MIKRVTDTDSLSGVNSPLFPLICVDFKFPQSESDGVFFQEIDDKKALVLSLKGDLLTCIKLSGEIDFDELYAFISFWGVTNFLFDFQIEHLDLKKRVLMECEPIETSISDIKTLSSVSNLREYKSVFELISTENGDFDIWFPVFSKKINKGNALGVYAMVSDVSVSTSVAPYVYNDTAIIAGVFTRGEYRNQGFASKCVKSLINECKARNVQKIYLWCEDENINFYKNSGFTVCGEVYTKEE